LSEPFTAEIRIFAGNYAPSGWAFCNGQLIPIGQNTAYFSLVGTTYGGDGESTFALPNLQDRVPVGVGSGPGLDPVQQGEKGGAETVTLSEANLPAHTHPLQGTNADAELRSPDGGRFAATIGEETYASASEGSNDTLVVAEGGGQSHDNMQPYLVMSYITALVGLYPS